ncbi:hypothetical protein BHM03_00024186 [Ensete ventricosum]|nr:hypothetical protein BHM03_00024186 [Ensete ventricosum]
MMRLGTHLECVRSLSRVPRICQDGTMEFAGRRPRLIGRLSEVAEKLVRSWEDMDPGSSLGIGPRFGRCSGSISRVRLDFTEGIEKIARNTPGDHQRKTMTLAARNAGGCRITGMRS